MLLLFLCLGVREKSPEQPGCISSKTLMRYCWIINVAFIYHIQKVQVLLRIHTSESAPSPSHTHLTLLTNSHPLIMKIASATYGSVLAFSLSANAVTQAIEHHAHPNLKGGKRLIKRDTSLIINVPESVTLTGSSSSIGTSIDHLFSKFAYEVAARVEIPSMYDFSPSLVLPYIVEAFVMNRMGMSSISATVMATKNAVAKTLSIHFVSSMIAIRNRSHGQLALLMTMLLQQVVQPF